MKKNNFWKKKNVLITGISGFVGSNLAKNLSDNGANLVGLTKKIKSGDKSLLKFRNIYRETGLISDMMNKNYNVWQYVQSDSMQHNDIVDQTNLDLPIHMD